MKSPHKQPDEEKPQQYIISMPRSRSDMRAIAPEQHLGTLARQLEADPAAEVVRAAGRQDEPERLIVRMTRARAEELKAEHRGALVVEPDAP